MPRKPPRQNPIRDFVKETLKCGWEPRVKTATLPDGTVQTEMRATDRVSPQPDQEPNEWDTVL